MLPKIYQHVNFPTRGKNTLDLVYTNIKGAYKASPLPHIGLSDHLTVLLEPAYRPRVWSEDSTAALRDCFDTTDWDMFKQAATYNHHTDIQEYIETVTGYITKCIDDVTQNRAITIRANQKPWVNSRILSAL